jgi:hypothetical protein
LAGAAANLPGWLLVIGTALLLWPGRLLAGPRSRTIILALTTILLAEMTVVPGRLATVLAGDAWLAAWWPAASVTETTGLLAEFGRLPLVLDGLLALMALAGWILLPPRARGTLVLVSLLVWIIPLGHRPWFILCGPLWATAASRAMKAIARRLLWLQGASTDASRPAMAERTP